MKDIIFKQNIEPDPYEDCEYETLFVDGVDESLYGGVENNFDNLAKDGLFGDAVKHSLEKLEYKLGDDMYDSVEYNRLLDSTLSQSHIKFKRDARTEDNTLYSWKEWVNNIPYTRVITSDVYGYCIEKSLKEATLEDIEEVLSSSNPLIKLIADCLISSNDAHLRVRQMIKDGCDVDIKYLENKGMYFGGFNKGDI